MRDTTPRVGFFGAGLCITLLLVMAALLLMGALPNTAEGQEPRLSTRIPVGARVQIDSILAAARAAGLPVEPLVDRALEGAAKGAPPALIVTAVARLGQELASARAAFGLTASAVEIAAGASALRAGATAKDLVQLRQLRAGQPLTVAAAVLADLVTAGVPADTAIAAVFALAGGADDADYLAFRRTVQQDIALGASPAAALGVRLQSLGSMADSPAATGQSSPRSNKRKP